MIEFAIRKSQEAVRRFPDTVIVSGTYTIGKERVFLALAEALDSKICITKEKEEILRCLEWPALQNLLTNCPLMASIHVLPMKKLNVNVSIIIQRLLNSCSFLHVCLWSVVGFVSIPGLTASSFLSRGRILTNRVVTQKYSSQPFHTATQDCWTCHCVQYVVMCTHILIVYICT